MSVYREQESRHDKKQSKESSFTRKSRREESSDRRPIITQEKPIKTKPSPTTSKTRTSVDKLLTPDRFHKKRPEVNGDGKKEEKERKSSKHESLKVKSNEGKTKKESKTDIVYMRDVLERKIMKKMEAVGKIGQKNEEEKPKRSSHGNEFSKKEDSKRNRRDRTRTRTLSPTEVKQLVKSKVAFDMSSGDTRGEEIRKEKDEKSKAEDAPEEKPNTEGCCGSDNEDYEDDFEDYESDFEEDDESAEAVAPVTPDLKQTFQTKTLQELQTQPKSFEPGEYWKTEAQKRQIEDVKKSIEKENNEVLGRRKSIALSTPPITAEEDSDKENIGRKKGLMIDLSQAFKKHKKEKEAAAFRKRGEELLSMISLDTISYSIFEIPPIPYEEFMKTFGKSNTKQVHVQTNEDDLDEEVQTEEISTSNKWTQNPPEYLGRRKTGNEANYILTKEERLGVGGDDPTEEEEEISMKSKTNGLWSFLSWASQIVLATLERKSGHFLSLENMPNHSKAIAFADGFLPLNVNEVQFLKGRSITHLCLTPKNIRRLLSVHVNKEKSFQKSLVCIWSLRELSKPLKILIASNRVTSCSFDQNQGNLVFAGLSDGSICLWDLRESSVYHNKTTTNPPWSLQSATYTTAGNLRNEGHSSSIVAVRPLGRTEGNSGFVDFMPLQICSLDVNGTIIIWSVIQLRQTQKISPSQDLGLAHWGRVKLVKASSFSVFSDLRDEIPGLYITCNDIIINEVEEDGFYVANSLGSVHHVSSYGSLMNPKFYLPAKQDVIIESTCLEICPFSGDYFLVGCKDGSIRLHSRHQENPLISLNPNVMGDEKEAAVVGLTWMPTRPCVFFALDSMSRIHIWDLGISDMYPEVSLTLTEKKITCMKLLLPVSNHQQSPFIVIGTENGSIEIHKLKKEYGSKSETEVKNEMKMFLKYVSIL